MRSLLDLRVLALPRLRLSESQRTLLHAALIGVLGALATIAFRATLRGVETLVFGRGDSVVAIARGLPFWARLVSPAVGGVVAGLALGWARRLPGGKGSDYMEAIALGDGSLGVRASLLRALSSTATVASGGAIGREGSMVQLAALAGSLVGRWRQAPVPRRRLMVACGAAAGVATAYNAPIAGALFVAEIVLRSLAIESLGPLLVAAFAAHVTSAWAVGVAPVYHMPPFVLPRSDSALVLASLGLIAGLLAPLYLWVLDRGHALFAKWSSPPWVKLGLGGLGVGVISLASPEVWGNGYSVVNSMLQGGWAWQAVLLVLVLKVLAVSSTTGSGAVGGIFTPTLFMGAATGVLFETVMHALMPGTVPPSAAIAIGMGAFLSACTHAPLMSVLMIFEMTENYGVVVPLMLACVLGYYVSRVLRPASIYSGGTVVHVQAPTLTMAADLLRPQSATIAPGRPLRELEATFMHHRWPHVYVVDDGGRFLGSIAALDLPPVLRTPGAQDSPWPMTLLRPQHPRVQETTPLWQVLETFARHPGERLPVLDDAGRLLGHVTKTDIVLMFREQLGAA